MSTSVTANTVTHPVALSTSGRVKRKEVQRHDARVVDGILQPHEVVGHVKRVRAAEHVNVSTLGQVAVCQCVKRCGGVIP